MLRCVQLCGPVDSRPQAPLSAVLQARTLQPVAFPPANSPGVEPARPVSPALAGGFFTTELPGKPRGREGEFVKGDGSEKDFPGAQW